jgi:hypothetical protein
VAQRDYPCILSVFICVHLWLKITQSIPFASSLSIR